MKRVFSLVLSVLLLFMCISAASADRIPEKKGFRYIGAMKVAHCREYVTLRSEPYKTASAVTRVPLGAVVYNCRSILAKKSFLYCEYEGQSGYILKKYLDPAPEFEPPESSARTVLMTMDEVLGGGDSTVILDWKDFNISVVAAREHVLENQKTTEVMRVGCFINSEPLWGHIETVEKFSELDMLTVFIGGTEDDPQVMIYDGGYGLTMLDLLSGTERWTLTVGTCNLGNAAVTAVSSNGTMYITGSDGPRPVAITQNGSVVWKSYYVNADLYDPFEIKLKTDAIDVKYRSGLDAGYRIASLDYTGEMIGIREIQE